MYRLSYVTLTIRHTFVMILYFFEIIMYTYTFNGHGFYENRFHYAQTRPYLSICEAFKYIFGYIVNPHAE